jgi:hypothetical protein
MFDKVTERNLMPDKVTEADPQMEQDTNCLTLFGFDDYTIRILAEALRARFDDRLITYSPFIFKGATGYLVQLDPFSAARLESAKMFTEGFLTAWKALH